MLLVALLLKAVLLFMACLGDEVEVVLILSHGSVHYQEMTTFLP